jgi:hypothetical protein
VLAILDRDTSNFLDLVSFTSFLLPLTDDEHTMAIQREPGQKGVNWSNIAIGMSISVQ